MERTEKRDNEFITTYRALIKREGADKLLDYLMTKSDFFTAPASSRFHYDFEGGLCAHSLNVYNRLVKLLESEYGAAWKETYSPESVAIIGLLHDLCKINYYKVSYRNVKNEETGAWEKKPFYSVEDDLPYGHGEKSVYIISGFMRLTREEAMAINWHMGGFDDRVRGGSFTVGQAYYKYPLAALAHSADFLATYLDEREEEEK
ncbi:MAG: hydrolase [Clostridia bacterium]|nr:hydrolase [Clostridia bacterium]